MTISLEREIKFRTDLAFELPDLRTRAVRTVRQPDEELRTTYFDTPDLRLWQRGLTFRYRSGDEAGSGTWTVKLPEGGAGARLDRRELSWPGQPDAFPPEARLVLLGIVRRTALEPAAELVTERTKFVLHDSDGSAWGELDSDTVTVVGGHRDGYRFRQLEIELAPAAGGSASVEEVQRGLIEAGAHLGDQPKLAKALDLEASPSRTGPHRLNRKASLGQVIQASITASLDRLLDHDYRLRLDPDRAEPEDVHQARVATRRLRSDLKTFGAVLDPVWLEHTRGELCWLGGLLGEIRDADVLAGQLGGVGAGRQSGGAGELRLALSAQRRASSRRLSEAMAGERYLNLLDRLHAAAALPPVYAPGGKGSSPRAEDPAGKVLPKLLQEKRRAVRKKVRKAGRHPSDGDLHRIRIRAKQLRYAAETATPVLGKEARGTAGAAEDMQKVLGEHHDAVAATEWLQMAPSWATPAASFAAGRLSGEQFRRKEKLSHRWRSAFLRLERTKG